MAQVTGCVVCVGWCHVHVVCDLDNVPCDSDDAILQLSTPYLPYTL